MLGFVFVLGMTEDILGGCVKHQDGLKCKKRKLRCIYNPVGGIKVRAFLLKIVTSRQALSAARPNTHLDRRLLMCSKVQGHFDKLFGFGVLSG